MAQSSVRVGVKGRMRQLNVEPCQGTVSSSHLLVDDIDLCKVSHLCNVKRVSLRCALLALLRTHSHQQGRQSS